MCLLWIISRGLDFKRKQITLSGVGLTAILADTPRKMTAGLMFRKSLKRNECMLFVFPNDGTHPIWMRNMRFSLDILWLDSRKRIVDVVEAARPISGFDFSSYKSKKPSRYVVELNAGFVKRHRIKIGDRMHLSGQ